jgi:SAM-dependent methyltransferase
MGAKVTGCDFSEVAIQQARLLAKEVQIPNAEFICCNLYDLKQHLEGSFDVVFTSYGTIGWLPDLQPWADIIAHYLKPGGFFYMADFHPALWMLDDKMEALTYSYFNVEVIETQQSGTYADREAPIQYSEYGWNHSMSDLLNSLLKAGLQLEFFNEYPYSPYDCFANTVRGEDGFFRIKNLENKLPMVYSLKMSKPL